MYALRHCLCSYVANFDNDEEATEEKNAKQFFGVSKLQKLGCARGGDLCLDQNLPRT